MARANWKGHLRLSLVSCAVALYPAVTSTSKVKCHTINRRTGNRINEEVVDSVTREPVPREDRIKGCEVAKGELVPIEDEELDAIRLESTHTINIESFVDRDEVDVRYLEKPYYMAPEDKVSREAFAVIRDAMRERGKAGLGRLVMYRKERVALIEPYGKGMMVTLLRMADEVRSPTAVFEEIADFEAPEEMRTLAAQLIERATAAFDASRFEDRYEQALSALIQSKARPEKTSVLPAGESAPPPSSNVVNLMDILRRSVEAEAGEAKPARKTTGSKGKSEPAPKPAPRKNSRPAAAPAKQRKSG